MPSNNSYRTLAQTPGRLSPRVWYAQRDLGCVGDCDLDTGLKIGGGTPFDNTALINACLASATPQNPIHLILDGAFSTGTLSIPNTGYVNVEGLGWGTGVYLVNATNGPGFCNPHRPYGQDGVDPIPFDLSGGITWPSWAFTLNGKAVRFANFRLNGNRAGNSTSGYLAGAHVAGPLFCGFDLANFDGVDFDNVWSSNTPSFNVRLNGCNDATFRGCRFSSDTLYAANDGVHIDGGCNNVLIDNCYFHVGDDAVAFNTDEGYSIPGSALVFSNSVVDNCSAVCRVLGQGQTTKRVVIKNVVGTAYDRVFTLGLQASIGALNEANSDVTVSGVSVTGFTGAWAYLSGAAGVLEFNGCKVIEPATAAPIFNLQMGAGSAGHVISRMALNNFSVHRNRNGSAATPLLTTGQATGTIGRLELNGVHYSKEPGQSYADIPTLVALGSVTVNTLAIRDSHLDGVGTVASGSAIGKVIYHNVRHEAASTAAQSLSITGGSTAVDARDSRPVNVTNLIATSGGATVTVAGNAAMDYGQSLTDLQVANGTVFLAGDHSGLPAIKVGGVVKLLTTSTPPSALAAGTASAGSVTPTTASATATDATGGTTPYTYQWYQSTTPGTRGSAVSGQTTRTLSATGLTASTAYYYTIVYTDAASATASSNQVTVTTASPAVGLQVGNLAWWRLTDAGTGTRLDSSPAARHLAAHGTPAQAAAGNGLSGNATSFDGSSWLTVVDDALAIGSGDRTYSTWVNFSSVSASSCIFGRYTDTPTAHEFLIYYETTTNHVLIALGYGPDTGRTPLINTWHMFVFGYDSAQAKPFYSFNSAAKTYISGIAAPATVTGTPYALGATGDGALKMVGRQRGAGAWSRVLTDAEIVTLYNGGVPTDVY